MDMIKNLIDSMSYSKMNVFHWHITDSQSFPLYFDSLPEFAEFGAYSPEMTYNKWDVEEIVRYAARRGVRVLPEFDSPAHVGAGWEAVDSSYTLCVNRVTRPRLDKATLSIILLHSGTLGGLVCGASLWPAQPHPVRDV